MDIRQQNTSDVRKCPPVPYPIKRDTMTSTSSHLTSLFVHLFGAVSVLGQSLLSLKGNRFPGPASYVIRKTSVSKANPSTQHEMIEEAHNAVANRHPPQWTLQSIREAQQNFVCCGLPVLSLKIILITFSPVFTLMRPLRDAEPR
jgi:hypothetical protein